MGERTSYPPGTFSYTDLSTSDPDAAKRFYTELFGWDFEDSPIPEEAGGGVYTMLRKDGKDVAALYKAGEGQPNAWASYVTVESADSTAAKATDLGGTLIMEPFDVMEVGRMTTIQDPTGGILNAWEPHGSIGASLVNVPGALTMNQLNTSDPEAAERFYTQLFDWRTEQVGGGDNPYWGIYLGDRVNGGMMPLPPDAGAPSHWMSYFGTSDVDADADRIGALGGTVMFPPTDVPGGRILVAHDEQGAVFGLFAGRFDD
jgi:predicted enzyme related to lactoylglutathione lyase